MVGSYVNHYKMTDKLGEGGMGVVYLAEDTRLGRQVAIKFLPPRATARMEDRKRFEQEARAAARLNHPNICTVHAFDEHEGRLFIVMEYVDGPTLRDRIVNDPPTIEEAIDFAIQTSEALAEAHRAGVLHRDIKPSNLMVDRNGRIKVMDFGLARLRGSDRLTEAGSTLGTKAYMSPEQIQGGKVDHRTDVFAFGVVFYELLTEEHPFAAEYEQAVAYKLVNEDPVPPSAKRPGVDPELDRIVIRCLAKEPANRYSDASAIASVLRGDVNGVALTGSWISMLPGLSLTPGGAQRRTAILSVAVMAVLLVAALLLFPTPFGTADGDRIPTEKRLVVLPFTNLSEETIPQSLSDGIMETLTSKITQLEQREGSLWVVPSSEVRYERVSSVTEAARLFGANLGVTGSIQRSDDQFRLTMNLVDGSTLSQLRSSVLEVEWTDIARLQDELARELATMLNVELSPQTAERLTAGGSAHTSAYLLYTEGRGYLSRHEELENVREAIRKFDEAIALDAEFVRAHAALGEAYWRKYELTRDREWVQKAAEHGEKAIHLGDGLAEAHITMALIYNGMSRHDDALAILAHLEEPENSSSAALTQLGRAYEGLGRLDRAEEAYKQAVERKRTYWGVHNELGVFYYHQGRFREAAEAFATVVELTPDNIRGYNNLGAMYIALDDFERAREIFEHSLSIAPNGDALSNLGTLYYREGNYAKAIDLYEEALEHGAVDYLVWGNLGSAYYWIGKDPDRMTTVLQRAIELAEQAREVSPGNPSLVVQLAGYYAHLGEEQRARTLLTQATSMDALNTGTMASAAHIYEQLGNRSTALNWLEEALAKGYRLEAMDYLPGTEDLWGDARQQGLLDEYEYELPQATVENN